MNRKAIRGLSLGHPKTRKIKSGIATVKKKLIARTKDTDPAVPYLGLLCLVFYRSIFRSPLLSEGSKTKHVPILDG